ncbi:centromere protein C [Erinaceus europaeus]|uniref:Centromere protein C n=1 Tax=Erinaceus europaeus TaxID=9365 RepID=A0ABM3X583_ERIEU|nr:centromere protein C [Erinaceus europaeus]
MASSGLDHLKNDYRRRFCQPSRTLHINTGQGQNVLEILQDCFEEQSFANDFSTNSTKSLLYLTPKTKDMCVQSPSKKVECQNSHPKSVPVSSGKKQGSLQATVGPSEAVNESGQTHEIDEKVSATNAASQNKRTLRKISENLRDHNEDDMEFYLSVDSPILLDTNTHPKYASVVQRRDTYTFENSVNMLCSSTERSLKTKKRLNFEDKNILKKVEMEDQVSEGSPRKKSLVTSQERMQDSEYKSQPQAKKSFSTLFLETVKKKSESGSVVKHITTVPAHSSPANDMQLLEDEFIIDASDRSFSNRSWITIPRKSGAQKQCIVSPAENTELPQSKSRNKVTSSSPKTLTCEKHFNSHPVEKSQISEKKMQSESCVLTGQMKNNHRSTKHNICPENMGRSSGNKRTVKQKQRRNVKTTTVEEQVDLQQSKDKNINMPHTTQDKLQANSDRNLEECQDSENAPVSPKQVQLMGSKKSSRTVPHTETPINRDCKKKNFSDGFQENNKLSLEVSLKTCRKSRRLSRPPSDWWVVKPDHNPVYSNSSVIANELLEYDNKGQKSAGRTNCSSKSAGKKSAPLKKQKRASQCSSRARKSPDTEDSEGITDHEEIPVCSQNEPLEDDEADLAKEKKFDCSGDAENTKDQDSGVTAETVPRKSQARGGAYKTPPSESNSDSKDPKTSGFEESGPSRVKNCLMFGENDSDGDDKDIEERSDDSEVKGSKVTPVSKIHHKLVLPSNTPNVRRTKRTRLKPLEYWRGERIDYHGRPSGGFVIGGVLSPGIVTAKRKAKGNTGKVNKIINRKKICLDHNEKKSKLVINLNIPLGDPLQPTRVKDPETRELVFMDLVRPRDTYQFFIEHSELKVYKTLDTPFFSTGKLILGPHQEKGKQHVGSDTLIFYVNFGDLLCILHETPYVITTGDSFYIPSGNYYNIKNLLNEESVLLFTQIKR